MPRAKDAPVEFPILPPTGARGLESLRQGAPQQEDTPCPAAPNRILATHVGSLVRPPKLVEFLKLIEAGQPYDKAAYEACLKESIEEVVRQQVEAGVDIVSDGEFSKGRNWAFYVHDRISGIATRRPRPRR